jgi:flagellar hook protein FlgE
MENLMEKPDRKVGVGAGMSGLAAVTAWAIGAYTQTQIPPEVAVAGAGFLTFVVQYLVPNK